MIPQQGCRHCKAVWEPLRSWCPYCGFGKLLWLKQGDT